jgi:hypothetical protein
MGEDGTALCLQAVLASGVTLDAVAGTIAFFLRLFCGLPAPARHGVTFLHLLASGIRFSNAIRIG